MSNGPYDLIVIGSGFSGAFFLHKYLQLAPATARVLVLEKGPHHDHAWHRENVSRLRKNADAAINNRTPDKPWNFNVAFGGASNCWWACTPRMVPEDFELNSRYGQGVDWPVTYDDLEDYYCQAEELMAISGPDDSATLFPRSRPYPQPPHLMTDPDKLFKKAFPDQFFVMPTGRARVTTANGRARCCASGVCTACPIDSKFTVLNEMAGLFSDSRVTLLSDAPVETIDTSGNVATGVRYTHNRAAQTATANFIALGANALFNPHLLLKSGIDHPQIGKGLYEQLGTTVEVYLGGVDNFQGSTSLTCNGYMLYPGEHRRHKAAAMIETSNVPKLRDTRGKWRHYLQFKVICDDLRQDSNTVTYDPAQPEKPVVQFRGHSSYAHAAIDDLGPHIERILGALPVETYRISRELNPTQSHILGTAVMGNDPVTSVVDRHQIHHTIRNLAILGGSAFPTATPSNPTLTMCALALWSADKTFA